MVQNYKNDYYDHNQIDRVFEIEDMVYLRLQPFQKSSLKKRKVEKLQPRFIHPYKILHKVEEASYKLELIEEINIHNTFHVSLLLKIMG